MPTNLNTANYKNKYVDYEIFKYLSIFILSKIIAILVYQVFCWKTQNNYNFLLKLKRDTDDFDADMGQYKFIFETEK
tara:strand:+ start:267 stop:497 length:231 start_codon:yes stop_codon:yes gene_type:complete